MRFTILVFAAFLGLGCAPAALAGGGCYATCKSGEGSCEAVKVGSNTDAVSWRAPEVKLLSECIDRQAKEGSFHLRFRYKGEPGEAVVEKGEVFKKKLAVFKTLDCLPGDKSVCAEDGFAKVRQGKAFDSDAPATISGEPCRVGLPCGKVGLAADGSFAVRVDDPALSGVATFFPSRGNGGTSKVDMAAGSMLVPAGALKPGETYRYRLVLANGSRAEGEFVVMSKQAQRDSDAALSEALKTAADEREQAVIQSLLLDGRDWEAFQRTLGARP